MTIGKKMMPSVGAMLLMLLALAGSSLYSIAAMDNELDKAANQTAKKLDLASSIAMRSSEMLSFERGSMVRMATKDIPKAESYHNSFNEQSKLILVDIGVARPLITTEDGRKDLETLAARVSEWSPFHQELWEKGRGGNLEAALSVYDQHNLAIAKEIAKIAEGLKDIQKQSLAEAIESGHSKATSSRWIAIALVLAALAMGAVVVKVILDMNRDLRRAATELGQGAEQITSAASQVASSSQSLAQGASQQAASLEETSASSQEITSMTRKNADNSKTAAEVMGTVDREVREGNQTLDLMVVSMQQINASSDKIAKIIKVIDEIAFQTNILALNAAVEAARAGEAGMGFAVVADEVRNLAQRSAQAAKDTSELIEESIATSRDGNAKLEQVAGVIRAITTSSTQVKTLVDEVNIGSQEQARGIEQISKAVAQMDQVTQGTAASAEQSASASEELSAQAQAMNEIVKELGTLVGGVDLGRGRAIHRDGPRTTAPAMARSLGALKTAVSQPKPRTHMETSAMASGSGSNEFPMDDNFAEM